MSESEVWHPSNPGYARWMMQRTLQYASTQLLLCMLVSRDERMEMHNNARTARSNDPVEYTDAVDRDVLMVVVDAIAGRIR